MFYWFLKIFIAPIVKFIWIEKVEGLENIPKKGGVIIASNHESYFDFICFLAIAPRRIFYLAGEIFFKKWWWRPFVVLLGQIKVVRNQRDKSIAVSRALDILEQGKVFGIFPEGTRSVDGNLQRAYTGVARLALIARTPIIPVGMIGTFEIMSRHDRYPHFKKCKIRISSPIYLDQYYDRQKDKKILKYITDKIIMRKIAGLVGEEYNF